MAFIILGFIALPLSTKIITLENKFRRIFKILLIIIGLPILFIAVIYGPLFVMISYGEHFVYTSPDGKHDLIIIESGFLDATVRAYPFDGLFYKRQNNGYLSYHDMWSIDEGRIEIEWFSDKNSCRCGSSGCAQDNSLPHRPP